MCNRCGDNKQLYWNKQGYLYCNNCGFVCIEPINQEGIDHNLISWGLSMKEEWWIKRIRRSVTRENKE